MSATSPPALDFSGLWIPLITPLRDGAVDHPALEALVKQLAATGITGFVVCGSTGEAAALDEDEQLAVLHTVAAAAPALPRLMGIAGAHLGRTLAWVRRLHGEPIDGLLVPAPNYIRPSQGGLIEWFSRIADAAAVPLAVYDIPCRTGSPIALQTLQTLAAHPRILAIKDCGGDMAKTRALIADGRLQLLAGEDAQLFATLAEGGAGAITASAHLHTARFVELLQLLRAQQLAAARTLWQQLVPLIELLFAEPNPGPLKAALAQRGRIRDELRSPMTRASEDLCRRLSMLEGGLSRR